METLKYILSVLLCLPIWSGLTYLIAVALDRVSDWFESIGVGDSFIVRILLGPFFYGLILLIPGLAIFVGFMAWFLATSIFGLA